MNESLDRLANHFTDRQSEVQRTHQFADQLTDIPTDRLTDRQGNIESHIQTAQQ